MIQMTAAAPKIVPLYQRLAALPAFVYGGKTGTAQIWDPTANGGKGDWKRNIFNFSFVGFIGKEAPRLVVAVRINEGKPTINRPGEIVLPVMSFELFRRIATDAMEVLDLPEVSCVAILDADKEGFLRSQTSLIQTIGRAARNASRAMAKADTASKNRFWKILRL